MRIVALLLLLWAAQTAAELSLELDLAQQQGSYREGVRFSTPQAEQAVTVRDQRTALSLHLEQSGWLLDWGLIGEYRDETEQLSRGLLRELYYDGSSEAFDWSLGKKVLSWGVGQAFRPLDLVQQKDQLALNLERLEGVPLVATERYTETGAWSLVLFDRNVADPDNSAAEVALRRYDLLGDNDLQLVAHWSEAQQFGIGGGVVQVVGESLSWHASLWYQQRYTKPFNRLVDEPLPLSVTDPIEHREFDHCGRAVAGVSHAWASGWSLLTEGWFDCEGYTLAEWRELRDLADRQRALLGQMGGLFDQALYGNLSYSLPLYQRSSLMQNNLFMRLAYDGEKLDPWLDLQITPDDGGAVMTLASRLEWRQGLSAQLGVRLYGGRADSMFGSWPERYRAFLSLRSEWLL